ncbi:MAG: hypothetical protein N3B18_05070, partial [Desulfobacterota bacterium]|nr:hypothetical protein [Thermodesulfobacteriota bacterium]
MTLQQGFYIAIASALLTIAIYHFFLGIFIHRRIDRHFYFSLSTFGGCLYALGAFLLILPFSQLGYLVCYRLRMYGLLLCIAAWFYCMYDIYFKGS